MHKMTLGMLSLCGLSLLAQPALADDIERAIDYRQAALKTLAGNFGPLGAMAQGRIDYDAEAALLRAERVAALAPMPWEGFLEGSLRGDGHGLDTDALAAIGDDWDDFASRQQALIDESQRLAEVAQQDDFNALRRQVAATANTCRSCHDAYRAD
ncbi:c-type cytochrome [Halomonas sp. 328]|uniref:c-type cytochrome n=1 Tax=Halomonas sp. 328 TaxID=2776704 RepID=UPI0018A757DA|nr:cytochrome c [Halomonas sp. 328]MBF8221603.1 cytochrome c [Halomonas sp. 328]